MELITPNPNIKALRAAREDDLCAAYGQALADHYQANWDSCWGPPDIPRRAKEFRAEALPLLRAGGNGARLAMGKPIPKRICEILGIAPTAKALSNFLRGE